MNALVLLKVVGLNERLAAVITLVWLLTRVNSHVSGKVAGATETLPTLLALVRLLV